jgi:dipeptidyl aminopeptidase/acylaminoacyl peptidase
VAQAFDADRFEAHGEPYRISDNVSAFSASATGALATRPVTPPALHRLVWRDRRGRELSTIADGTAVDRISLAPDEKRLAYLMRDEQGRTDIWVRDLSSGTTSRLFTDGEDLNPVWSPSGQALVFALGGLRTSNPLYRLASLSAKPDSLGVDGYPTDWSGDGRYVLIAATTPMNFLDLHVFEIEGRKLTPFVESPQSEFQGQFSRETNGPPRWIAYTSTDSGAGQIYVKRFIPGRPAEGQRWRVSMNGGMQPRWQADNKELFYRDGGKLMAVALRTDQEAIEVEAPLTLFEAPSGPDFAVAENGARFLLLEPADNRRLADRPPVTITTNWQAELR